MSTNDDLILRIEKAKLDSDELERLIEDYMPFIKAEISKKEDKFIDDSSDLKTIGMVAFKEAIEKYDADKGNFISFASRVISLRIIDHQRSENKFKREILSDHDGEDSKKNLVEEKLENASLEKYTESQINLLRREEIVEFSYELAKYEIDFSKLVKSSPKKKQLKDLYYQIAHFIAKDHDLYTKLSSNKTLSIEQIISEFNINRKKVERGRIYIIALVIIIKSDFTYIKDYLEWR